MSLEITPMKRLSSGINEFRNHVKNFFKETDLNKSAPKYNPYAWRDDSKNYSKGVSNDFIMIFNCKGIEPSFAISFTYIGLPLEKQRVSISIKKSKDNSTIVNSSELSIDEFKLKLNQINKDLNDKNNVKNRDEISILEKVSEIFLSETYDLKKEIKTATKNINKLKEDKRKEYDIENLEANVVNTTNLYDSAEKKVKKLINACPEKAEILRLELLLNEAKNIFNIKSLKIEEKYNLKQLESDKIKAKKDLQKSSNEMNLEIDSEIEKLPGIVTKRLKP